MQIAIQTASDSVRRALEQVINASGHRLSDNPSDADLVLLDQIHPRATSPLTTPPTLLLCESARATTEHTIPCPIHPSALIQRLSTRGQVQPIALGQEWSLDMLSRALIHPSAAPQTLTEKECQLLRMLVTANRLALTRDDLLEAIWGVDGTIDTHTLETHIYRLRSKLAALNPSAGDIVSENSAYRWETNN